MDSNRLIWHRVCLLLVILISAMVPMSGASAEPPIQIEIDKPFPKIALASMEDGAPTSIEHFRGRMIILHVFASW